MSVDSKTKSLNKKETISNSKEIINSNKNIPVSKFDWYSYESGIKEEYKKKLKYLYNKKQITIVNEYEIFKGVITRILDKEVLVNINFKSEGIISLNEFSEKYQLKIGEKLDVMVAKKEYKGKMILSYKKATILKAWKKAKKYYKNGERIKGKIIGKTKGGMIVKILDYIEAFLPGSQIEKKPISNFESYFTQVYNQSMAFKIIKINPELKNIVVSHKALIAANRKKQKKERLLKLEKGQVIKVKIKNITGYGVFCDLGGVDGLVHYTDLYWKRINHHSDIFNLSEEINVVILDFNDKTNKVQLGIKQLMPHPWDELTFKVGDQVSGVVTSLTEAGAFIELKNTPRVEASLHVSEMSWSSKLKLAKAFVKKGQLVACVILTINRKERKMSLGMKQLSPDPWLTVYNKYCLGSKHSGKIINFTNSGIFIQLEKGVAGMIHQLYMDSKKVIKNASNLFKIGNIIDVIVLEVDLNSRRISLCYKKVTKLKTKNKV